MVLASSRSHRSPRMERVVSTFGFKDETRRGSVGVKIGLIAEQKADLYLHLSPSTKQWDTSAPEIILTEAGGRLTISSANRCGITARVLIIKMA